MAEPLLEVKDLRVHFETEDGLVQAVDGVSYTVERGRALGIVGESGSGKSVSSLTVMGLTRSGNARISGEIRFQGQDLLNASGDDMRKIRGGDIAMIFQDPLSSLHPFYKIGDQLAEARRAHTKESKAKARDRAIEMLNLVGIPDPRRRIDSYPHEFSGGMRQRVMIAMALINDPKLLIADEPTTALDVTVQAQILELIQRLQRELDTAVVMITHDLGVVAEVTDEIAVMYAGRIVEYGAADTIFAAPEHPYTWGLLKSIPRLDTPREEELVPIFGRPPSLILKPPGCSFHPRCPYVREAHKKVDPGLEPAGGGDPKHAVACLLPSETRRALWTALQSGASPEEARERTDIPDRLSGAAAAGQEAAAAEEPAAGEQPAPAGEEPAPAGEEVSGS
jgi:peptide/nickel transport system ATP-binding protein